MTFTSQITRQASERTILARITPKRDVTLQLTLVAGTEYQVAIPYNVMSVTLNGVALTRLTAAPTVLNSFFYNATTGVLFVNSATPPNATTGVYIAFYRIYLTSGPGAALPDDPSVLTAGQTLHQWEPRIGSDPSFAIGFDNITKGVFQLSQLTLDAANSDNFFNKYFTNQDSFYNAKVDIWAFIDSITNIRRFYTGIVASLSIGDTLNLRVNDFFNRLIQTADMGSRVGAQFFTTDLYGPFIQPSAEGTIVPFICGASSRVKNVILTQNTNLPGAAPVPGRNIFSSDGTTNEAYCALTYTNEVFTNVNRRWNLCRVPYDGVAASAIRVNSFTSLSRVSIGIDGGRTIAVFANGPNALYQPGDTFRWVQAGITHSCVVISNVTTIIAGLPYNLVMEFGEVIGPAITVASTSVSVPAMGLQMDFGPPDPLDFAYISGRYFLRYGVDYNLVEVSENAPGLPNRQRRIQIQFVNNFEGNLHENTINAPGAISPERVKLYYRVSPAFPFTHGALLQRFAQLSGMSFNAATFTAADAALPVNVAMQIPAASESAADAYLKYAQKILGSTFGYLTVNDLAEVEYYLLSAPAAGSQISENNSIQDATSVEYQDISTAIVAKNVDIPTVVKAEDPAVRYLHEIENTLTFEHVLQDISTRITAIFTILKRRKAVYSATLSHNFLTMLLGQDISLIGSDVLGFGDPSGTYNNGVNLKTQNVSVTMDSVRIEATDLAAF